MSRASTTVNHSTLAALSYQLLVILACRSPKAPPLAPQLSTAAISPPTHPLRPFHQTSCPHLPISTRNSSCLSPSLSAAPALCNSGPLLPHTSASHQFIRWLAPKGRAYKIMDKSLPHYYGQPAEQYDIHGQPLPPAVLEIPGLSAGQPQSVANVPSGPNMQNVQNVNIQPVPPQSMGINMNLTITAAPPVNVAQNSLANGVNQSLHPGLQNGGILNMANMANNSQYYSGPLVNPIVSQDLRNQSLPSHALPGSHGVAGKFSDGDVELLNQLYSMGERHKWKLITKEINHRSALRRGDDMSGVSVSDDERSLLSKNVSPTYVIKQYQNLFGLPKNQNYFGVLGLSVPYVVSEKGWDDLADTEKFTSPE